MGGRGGGGGGGGGGGEIDTLEPVYIVYVDSLFNNKSATSLLWSILLVQVALVLYTMLLNAIPYSPRAVRRSRHSFLGIHTMCLLVMKMSPKIYCMKPPKRSVRT